MSEYPKVAEWPDGDGFDVSYAEGQPGRGYTNSVHNANIRALHAVLTEKIAELDAKRFQVVIPNGESYACWVQGPDGVAMAFRFGTPEQNKADAEEYAAKLNAREGLA